MKSGRGGQKVRVGRLNYICGVVLGQITKLAFLRLGARNRSSPRKSAVAAWVAKRAAPNNLRSGEPKMPVSNAIVSDEAYICIIGTQPEDIYSTQDRDYRLQCRVIPYALPSPDDPWNTLLFFR